MLNGNAFLQANPNALTAEAARVLEANGQQAVQLAYPTIATLAASFELAKEIETIAKGQTIGLVGFSAGGSLAARLSGEKRLHVSAVLDDFLAHLGADAIPASIRRSRPR